MRKYKGKSFKALIISTVILITLFAATGVGLASSSVELQVDPVSMNEHMLRFTVHHPQNTAKIDILGNDTFFAAVQPEAGATTTVLHHDAVNNESRQYKAVAYAADGSVIAESDGIMFRAADYAPLKPSCNLTNGAIINGRLEVLGNVDSYTQVVYLVMNGKIAYRTTPADGLFQFKNIGLLKGRTYIQVIAENPWGRGFSETIQIWTVGSGKSSGYILIDKDEMALSLIENGVTTLVFPIAIGTPKTPTPVGSFVIGAKLTTNTSSEWGARRMTLLSRTKKGYHYGGYNIHGTNRPGSIGKMASGGCIRLYNEDAITLFNKVSIGTEVVIVP